MNIGIFYATYSGGTQMAADFLTQDLKASGHKVDLKPISNIAFEDLLDYDLRIFTSPSWDNENEEGQPHEDFIKFIKNNENKIFDGKYCAVFGLGDIYYSHFCGAVNIIEEFIRKLSGKLITKSMKIDNYMINIDGYNKKLSDWAKGFTK
jgi:flavodoxin I